jgi:fatty acid desaturase
MDEALPDSQRQDLGCNRSDPGRTVPDKTLALPAEFPELPRLTRILLLGVGCILFLIGFIGLLLPVFPQTVPLAVGTALITLGSRTAHRYVHRALDRWPRLQQLVARTQHRLHSWVAPKD